MIEPSTKLSSAGQQRREEILKLAVRRATERRYNRIERQLGAVLVVALLATGTFLVRKSQINQRPEIVSHTPRRPADPKTSGPETEAVSGIQIVRTDPGIVERLRIKPQPPRWKEIGDDELLATLAQAGKPAGIIEINGRSRVAFR